MAKRDLMDDAEKDLRNKVASKTKEFFLDMARLGCEQVVMINHPLFNDNMFIGFHASKIGAVKFMDTMKQKVGEALFEEKHLASETSAQIVDRLEKKKGK